MGPTQPTKGNKSLDIRTEWDMLVYMQFWPLVTFSYFLAGDSIMSITYREETNAWLRLCMNTTKLIIHMFCINSIILTSLEVFLMYKNGTINPNRQLFPEVYAIIASVCILILTFLAILVPIVPYNGELNGSLQFGILFVAWLLAMSSVGIPFYGGIHKTA